MSLDIEGAVLITACMTDERLCDVSNKQAQDEHETRNQYIQDQIDALVVKVNHMNAEWTREMMRIAAANGDMKHYKKLERRLGAFTDRKTEIVPLNPATEVFGKPLWLDDIQKLKQERKIK